MEASVQPGTGTVEARDYSALQPWLSHLHLTDHSSDGPIKHHLRDTGTRKRITQQEVPLSLLPPCQ